MSAEIGPTTSMPSACAASTAGRRMLVVLGPEKAVLAAMRVDARRPRCAGGRSPCASGAGARSGSSPARARARARSIASRSETWVETWITFSVARPAASRTLSARQMGEHARCGRRNGGPAAFSASLLIGAVTMQAASPDRAHLTAGRCSGRPPRRRRATARRSGPAGPSTGTWITRDRRRRPRRCRQRQVEAAGGAARAPACRGRR